MKNSNLKFRKKNNPEIIFDEKIEVFMNLFVRVRFVSIQACICMKTSTEVSHENSYDGDDNDCDNNNENNNNGDNNDHNNNNNNNNNNHNNSQNNNNNISNKNLYHNKINLEKNGEKYDYFKDATKYKINSDKIKNSEILISPEKYEKIEKIEKIKKNSKNHFLSEFHYLCAYSNAYVVSTVMSVLGERKQLKAALLLSDSNNFNALDIALRRGTYVQYVHTNY